MITTNTVEHGWRFQTAASAIVVLPCCSAVGVSFWFGDSDSDGLILGMAVPFVSMAVPSAGFALFGTALLLNPKHRHIGIGALLGTGTAFILNFLALAALGLAIGS